MANEMQNLSRARQLVSELLSLTDQAMDKCKSARNWGLFDILGGGTISSLVKHSKISSTQSIMNDINYRLRELSQCISINNLPQGYNVDRGIFATFADFAWDGLFSDLWMQSKIKNSMQELQNLKNNLLTLQRELG